MIAKHPGIAEMTFKVRVKFDDDSDNEYEVDLNLHEMHRLVVSGELPTSVKMQRDAIKAQQDQQQLFEEEDPYGGPEEEATEE